MNDIYKDIVIDGTLDLGSFRGIGLAIDKNLLRRLMVYKENFPESYNKINNLLFNKKSGAAFSKLKFETDHEKTIDYAADIMQINPEINAEGAGNQSEEIFPVCSEYAAEADGSGLKGSGSVTETVKKIIGGRYSVLYFNGNSILNTEGVQSGYFEMYPIILSIAHITYFCENGWRYSDCGRDNDCLLLSSESGDYSAVFVNDTDQPRKYSICVRSLSKAGDAVHCVETKGPENSGNYCANWFRVVDKILPCRKDYGYCYNVEVKPFSVMTCTTLNIENINGVDTFEFSELDDTPAELPYIFKSSDAVLPLWDISGDFEEYTENDKIFIEQACIYEDISDKKSACTIFGNQLLCNYHLTVYVEFADDNKNNFAGIGICCGKNGEVGYGIRIYPDDSYEIIRSGKVADKFSSHKISVLFPNCLEIIINEKNIVYKLNGEVMYSDDAAEAPCAFSGYAALLSAYRRNTFSEVRIDRNEKSFSFCSSRDCLCGDFMYTKGWIKTGNEDNEFTNRTCVYTNKENSYFEFEFIGECAALFGKIENSRVKIEIDGAIVKAGTIEKSDNINDAFYIAKNLENTVHILKLTLLSGSLKFDRAQIYFSDYAPVQHAAIEISRKRRHKSSPLKKSTILLGAGLAAAGAGAFLLRKKFRGKKNKRPANKSQ